MRGFLKKLLRLIGYSVAVGLILLAMGAGLFRLAVIQLPTYQGELQAWVRTELDIDLDFSSIDARWSLLGPEISFLDATVIRVGDQGNPIVSADEATITLSPFALIAERRLEVTRLTLDGSRLGIERTEAGVLRLANLPEGGNSRTETLPAELPAITIVVTNGHVVYADRLQQREWAFEGVRIQLVRDMDDVVVEARAIPPQSLAERVEFSAQLSAAGALDDPQTEWRLFGEVRGLDLSGLPDLLPAAWRLPAAGTGDVSFGLDFDGYRVQQATLALALEGLRLGESGGGAGPAYARADMTLEWSRLDTGWALSASNLHVRRGGRDWSPGDSMDLQIVQDDDGLSSLSLRGDFLRLEDLSPLAAALPESSAADIWQELQPRGDVRGLDLQLARDRSGWSYAASASFDQLQVASRGALPGGRGITGRLHMDSLSGRLDLDSRDAGLDWPAVFADTLDLDELSGRLTWLRVAGGLRMVSDQVVLSTPDGHMRSMFELTWPDGDALPTVALESQIRDLDVAAAKRYFPLGLFPQVIGYLDRAILGGRVPQVDISLVGPLASFPFDKHEGRFSARAQVQDGSMAYVADWPVAEVFNGELSFTNAGWEAVGSGRVFGNLSENLRVGIEDVRNPVLNVAATTRGPLQDVLRFLRESPLLARHLGPDLELLQSDAGTAEVTFELVLPLLQRSAYRLGAGLEISGGVLSIDGFGPTVTDIDGGLRLDEAGGVSGSGIRASFLDAPVMLKVEAAGDPGYLADIAFEGAIEADAIQAAFNLPFVEQVLGRAWWRGRVSLPENRVIQARREPLRIGLESDLAGVDLRFPEPLGKPSQQSTQLEMEFVFAEADRLNVNGQLGEDRRFALSLRNREGDLSFRRGAIRFGGAVPLLPPRNGLSISGELESAGLDAWWELLRRQAAGGAAAGVLLGANLEIDDFSALGQQLGPAEVSVRQQAARWHLQIDSEPVAGEITWPLDLSDRPQVLADMARLYISTERISSGDGPDPRLLPGIRLHADDFVVGNWRFGALDADIEADPEGLNVASFTGRSEGFFMEGSGGWYQRPQGQETRVVLAASSENVAGALEQLGFDAITEAERAQLALNVYWPSAPSPGWEESITGGLNLRLERGSVLNLDPGAGRMVGLMSITALPRRLALDFRDVFNRGLVFDEMSGDFVIIDGNAYTDNLHLTGPVVDIGVVGRTGLRDRDYQQHAVVTSEPGRILPAVGFLASPQVAAALLLFSEIFKEPLNGATRASYCVTGSWSEPLVERQTPEQLEQNRLCADLPQLAEQVAP